MYNNHPSEFPSEPLPVMIDPTLLIVCVVLLMVIGVISFLWGRHIGPGGRNRAEDAARERILAHIRGPARAALNARPDEVPARAADLRRAIKDAAGPLMTIGQASGGAFKRLESACDGVPASPLPASISTGAGGSINIQNSAVVLPPPAASDPASASQMARIRAAVQELADYWLDPAREEDLESAQNALNRPTFTETRNEDSPHQSKPPR